MGEVEVKDLLNRHQLSATPQRIAVYQFFQNDQSHPDTDHVYNGISGQLPGISKATVYRILEEFNQLGLIKGVFSDKGKKRYDGNVSKHHHLICRKCDKVIDIEISPEKLQHLDALQNSKNQNFELEETLVTFIGYCNDCKL